MENMSEGLVIADFTGQPLHWNPAALEMHDIGNAEDVLIDFHNFKEFYELSTLRELFCHSTNGR